MVIMVNFNKCVKNIIEENEILIFFFFDNNVENLLKIFRTQKIKLLKTLAHDTFRQKI